MINIYPVLFLLFQYFFFIVWEWQAEWYFAQEVSQLRELWILVSLFILPVQYNIIGVCSFPVA